MLTAKRASCLTFPARVLCFLLIAALLFETPAALAQTSRTAAESPRREHLDGGLLDTLEKGFQRTAERYDLKPVADMNVTEAEDMALVSFEAVRPLDTDRSGPFVLRRDHYLSKAAENAEPAVVATLTTLMSVDTAREKIRSTSTLRFAEGAGQQLRGGTVEQVVEYGLDEYRELAQQLKTAKTDQDFAAARERWEHSARLLATETVVTTPKGERIKTDNDLAKAFERLQVGTPSASSNGRGRVTAASCRSNCLQAFLPSSIAPSWYDWYCAAASLVVCGATCYFTAGWGCYACLLRSSVFCNYSSKLWSIAQYVRCVYRC
jgi:hypothetical protein